MSESNPATEGPNPQRYREMQLPFDNSEEAASAFQDFLVDVGAAREKHRIAQVLTVVALRSMMPDGNEGEVFISHYFGDHNTAVALAACAYGELSKEQKDHLAKLLAGDARRAKAKR